MELLRLAYRALAGFTGEDVLAALQRKFVTVVAVLPPDKTGTMITCVVATKPNDSSVSTTILAMSSEALT
ncbi:MAG: hypothetical protein DLM60_22160 [Pseudonocardiales bacterium]|nr:hypothetical protein [Actinomycetota bacterium]PZS12513.1 MAG: hypothetical protein DLM60_22160 [Pseudonocardiales bacterium]